MDTVHELVLKLRNEVENLSPPTIRERILWNETANSTTQAIEFRTGMIPGVKHETDTTLTKEVQKENLVITTTAVTRETETIARICSQFNSKRTGVVNRMPIDHRTATSNKPAQPITEHQRDFKADQQQFGQQKQFLYKLQKPK